MHPLKSITIARFFFLTLAPIAFVFSECSDEGFAPKDPVELRCPDVPEFRRGEATFYVFASGAGSCSFDSTPGNLMIGAMNILDYADAQLCGARVSVMGPLGTVSIRIVDLCPECPRGNIDLSPLAFSQIADTILGRVPILWSIVFDTVTGPLVYHFNESSNQRWTAVQIRNHRYPIYSLSYLTPQQTYMGARRTEYNYFVAGMGTGPYTFRVSDIYGRVLVDSGIVHIPNGNILGRAQFEPCNRWN